MFEFSLFICGLSSVGLNLNWDSAVGPINIVYANILQSSANDTTDNIYFDIGYNF